MLKVITCITCCTFLFAIPQEREKEKAHPVHATQRSAGLALMTRAGDSFALAADGAQANADGTLSQVQKLFPVGKYGALVLAGMVSIQDPVDRPVREEINVATISDGWLKAHPDADVQSAAREINAQIADAGKKFFAARNPGKLKSFVVIFAGFVHDQPWVSATGYFTPAAKGRPMRAQPAGNVLQLPGEIHHFGNPSVELELTGGTSGALKQFKAEAPVKKYRSRHAGELTAQDYVKLFDVILRATESEEGKKWTGGLATAAPPNRLATVTAKDGFAWSRLEQN